MNIGESLVYPGVERSKGCSKDARPKRTEIFVSIAMAVVSATEAYEETAYR